MQYYYALCLVLTIAFLGTFHGVILGSSRGTLGVAFICFEMVIAIATIYFGDAIRQDWYPLKDIPMATSGGAKEVLVAIVISLWPYVGMFFGGTLILASLVSLAGLRRGNFYESNPRIGDTDTSSKLERLRSEKTELLRLLNPSWGAFTSAAMQTIVFGILLGAVLYFFTLEASFVALSLVFGVISLANCAIMIKELIDIREHPTRRQYYAEKLQAINQSLREVEKAHKAEQKAQQRKELSAQRKRNKELMDAARREEQKKKELEYWLQLDGHKFEHEFTKLLNNLGWNVQVTKASSDGGIDIFGKDDREKSTAIQCKRWKARVGVTAVRELRGVGVGEYDRLVVIGTGGFTKEAKSFAASCEVELWDSIRLQTLLNKRHAKAPKKAKRSQATANSNPLKPDLGIEAPKPKDEKLRARDKFAKNQEAQADVKAEANTSNTPVGYLQRFDNFTPYVQDFGESYMSESQLQHFQMLLMDWKKGLEESPPYRVSTDGLPASNADDRTTRLIEKIDSTLDRIKKDDFGYCAACGLEIGIRRLEARPTSTMCIDCKTLHELSKR